MTWLYRSAFTTLENVLYQIALSESSETTLATGLDTVLTTQYANHKQWLLSLIYEESAYLANRVLNRSFVPFKFTFTMKHRQYRQWVQHDRHIGVYVMRLPYDLLEVDSFTWDTDSFTSTDYDLLPYNRYPVHEIHIDPDSINSWPDDFADTISIVGTWGYHYNPSSMWVDSGDSIQDGGGINASVTSITVTDADAIGTDGFTRFQHLQYLQIEDEWLQVTNVNTSTNVLTVKRGQLGTTAATHANGTQIDVFVPDDLTTQATRRLVVQRFLNPSEQRVITTTPEGATISIANETIHLPSRRYVSLSA